MTVATTTGRPRVLLAITVYNGRGFVPRTLASATGIRLDAVHLDVLFLDDASPDVEFSQDLARRCADAGVGHYRTPRNLGIVRNVNLGLLRGLAADYDYVVVSNSDVIYPASFVEQLVRVFEADPTIGAATAWSNNVSIYSVPNEDPDRFLAAQSLVSEVSEDLTFEFGAEAVDIPAGISFAMMIRRQALEQVGLMDPVFGRGYCEETDWSRRCLEAGWRLVLVPSVFVYHAGRGSTLEAGLLATGETTVAANERVIDHRYPDFRREVDQFTRSDRMPELWRRGIGRVLRGQAERHGLVVHVSSTIRDEDPDDVRVRARVVATAHGAGIQVRHRGFRTDLPLPSPEAAAQAVDMIFHGHRADEVVLRDPTPASRVAAQGFASAGVAVTERISYPERV